MTIDDQSVAFWDSQAADFDGEPDHGLRDPSVREAWRRLLTGVVASEPLRIADLGCGTGSLSLLLAAEGHEVTGLDFSAAMIDVARGKAIDADPPLTFVVGDAADPKLPGGSYDVVLVRHVLWAMSDPDAALERWFRLLADGGRLVLIEGSWWTGAGMEADATLELVRRRHANPFITMLTDPELWGGPITDERYMVVCA